jgi:aminotransferase
MCRRIHDARDSLRLFICQNTALSCEETDGTYYLFPNISSTGLPDDLFCLRMREEAGVEVLPGSAFGSGGRGHIRLYLVRPKQQIEELGRRLQVFIDSRP